MPQYIMLILNPEFGNLNLHMYKLKIRFYTELLRDFLAMVTGFTGMYNYINYLPQKHSYRLEISLIRRPA